MSVAKEMLDEARAVLKQHWGYDGFRQAQETIILHVLSGEDVLAVLPTSYGKSVCYQVPAMLCSGCVVVVSPLIALMKDQVDDAQKRGVPADYVNSHVTESVADERYADLIAGAYKLFYVSPERLRNAKFRKAISQAAVSMVAVDEAHCASVWGHAFRPEYSRINQIVDHLTTVCEKCAGTGERMNKPCKACGGGGGTRPVVLAVTATATRDIEDDIAKSLGMRDDYKRIVGDPVRPNFTYSVVPAANGFNAVNKQLASLNPAAGRYILYAATQRGAEMIADAAGSYHGKNSVGVYHGGMIKDERERVQNAFKDGTVRIVVATCAFGMGIDVPDIRKVVHMGIPESVEAYVQESGRAGRDGLPCEAVLVDDAYTRSLRKRMAEDANPPYEAYQKVWKYLHAVLPDAETTLYKTIKTITAEVNDYYKSKEGEGLTCDAITSVLNVLASHGAVVRLPAPPGIEVDINVPAFQSVLSKSDMSKGKGKVAKLLWDDYVKAENATMNAKVHAVINKEELAKKSGFSEDTIRKYLMMYAAGSNPAMTVANSYAGKTTRIVKFNAPVADVVPYEFVQKRRDRAMARLASIIEYVSVDDRPSFIRAYFMGDMF